MKIAITGHSKGIGKACYDVLSNDYDVIGFSRSNGFNITEPLKILSASIGCDVFINNAYIMDTKDQINLFNMFFKEWKDDPSKFIVNIGSKSKYYPYNPNMPNLTANFRSGKGYNDNKTDLAEATVVALVPPSLTAKGSCSNVAVSAPPVPLKKAMITLIK